MIHRIRRSDFVWAIIGIGLSVAWFAYQLSLPPMFRGITCCDSVTYMTQARMIVKPVGDTTTPPPFHVDLPVKTQSGTTVTPRPPTSHLQKIFETLFANTAAQLPGYPAYLAVSIVLSNAISGAVFWVTISLMIALLLHWGSVIAFVTALRRSGTNVPAWIVGCMLALPASTALAATPMSDSLATSVLLFALAGTIMVVQSKRWRWVIPVGLLWAGLLWIRSTHLPALAAFFGILLLIHAIRWYRKQPNAFLLLFAIGLTLFAGFSPRIIACTRATGMPCVTPPAVVQSAGPSSIRGGLTGARTYTVIQPGLGGKTVTIPDAFFDSLHPACDLGVNFGADLMHCLRSQWWKLPWYAGEKVIGLFDQSFLNPHATYVTPPIIRWALRILSIPSLIGFVVFFVFLAFLTIKKKLSATHILLFGYFFIHAASILPLHVEQRYGLPLLSIGLIGFGLLCTKFSHLKNDRRILTVIALSTVVVTFLLITDAWDRRDPIPYVPMHTATMADQPQAFQDAMNSVLWRD